MVGGWCGRESKNEKEKKNRKYYLCHGYGKVNFAVVAHGNTERYPNENKSYRPGG